MSLRPVQESQAQLCKNQKDPYDLELIGSELFHLFCRGLEELGYFFDPFPQPTGCPTCRDLAKKATKDQGAFAKKISRVGTARLEGPPPQKGSLSPYPIFIRSSPVAAPSELDPDPEAPVVSLHPVKDRLEKPSKDGVTAATTIPVKQEAESDEQSAQKTAHPGAVEKAAPILPKSPRLNLTLITLNSAQEKETPVLKTPIPLPLAMIDERIKDKAAFTKQDHKTLSCYLNQLEDMARFNFCRALASLNHVDVNDWEDGFVINGWEGGVVINGESNFDDPAKLKLAFAIAFYQSSNPHQINLITTLLDLISTLNEPGKLEKHRAEDPIESLACKDDIDYLIFEAAPGPKGGEYWGREHRYVDAGRLEQALINYLKSICFPALVQARSDE